jgi:hypothetical protein
VLRAVARLAVVTSLVAGGLTVTAVPARAPFHLMEVQEVFAGTSSEVEADFVELEMLAAGQNFVGGHLLHLYDAAGARTDCTIPMNVPGAASGDPILFATTQAEIELGFDADFTMPPLLHGDGGAVCFENIDCVSWGSFAGTTTHPAGIPFPSGINIDMSIDRIADTNNSADDFTHITPDAVANAGSLGTITCQPAGPDGGFALKGLKAKVKGGRATITGRIEPPAPGESVKLTFFANGSPLRKLAAKTAALRTDGSFKKRFKVPTDATRCKVVVRFQGAKMGQRKFKC